MVQGEGNFCIIKLESNTGIIFAECRFDASKEGPTYVEKVTDSSRYFVLRIENKGKKKKRKEKKKKQIKKKLQSNIPFFFLSNQISEIFDLRFGCFNSKKKKNNQSYSSSLLN